MVVSSQMLLWSPDTCSPLPKLYFAFKTLFPLTGKNIETLFVVDASPSVIQGVDLIGLNPASAAEDLIPLCSGSLPLGVNFLLV